MSTELEKREFIVKKFLENPRWTFKKIAREVKADEKTVSSAIKRYQESFNLQRKHGSGRKKVFILLRKPRKLLPSSSKIQIYQTGN